MPKKALDHVKRYTLVHQEAGERVAQIMEADVSQASTSPDTVPRIEQTGKLRRKDIGARRISGHRLSAVAKAAALSAIVLGLPDFDTGTSRVRFSQSTCSHLAPVTSLRRAPVSSRSMMALAAIWFFSALIEAMRRWVSSGVKKPLPVDLRSRGETCGGVHAYARHVPLPCEIENIAQEHQDAIGGRPGVSLGPHVVDQPRYVFTGDLIEGKAPKGGQNVNAQDVSSVFQLRLLAWAWGK